MAPENSFFCPLPIIQAPMAGVQDSALAIAVSRSGGLGSLPCAMLDADTLAAELATISASGIQRYNLNFFCHVQPAADEARETRWLQALAPYYREYGLEINGTAPGSGRLPFSEAMLEVIGPHRPPVISFHFGLPEPNWIDEIKAWGGQVWSSATTLDEARWLQGRGADAVIAQGIEAGGHRGMFLSDDLDSQVGTMDLLAAITAALDIPVIAAGGIATPEKVNAALEAGAVAAQVGTAYLLCPEVTTSDIHRAALTSSAAAETRLTNLLSGRPARGIVNRLMAELGPISEAAPAFPLASVALAPLRAAAESQGAGDFSPLWCGTDASGCRPVSADEQTRWLASQVL